MRSPDETAFLIREGILQCRGLRTRYKQDSQTSISRVYVQYAIILWTYRSCLPHCKVSCFSSSALGSFVVTAIYLQKNRIAVYRFEMTGCAACAQFLVEQHSIRAVVVKCTTKVEPMIETAPAFQLNKLYIGGMILI
uniref:CMP/dCMP-type deaminase domain-containing protein n=1 Tax=Steinernema glaseri TaxID=37863 RepID=A0A1I7Y9X5_9BILA